MSCRHNVYRQYDMPPFRCVRDVHYRPSKHADAALDIAAQHIERKDIRSNMFEISTAMP